MKFHLSTIFLLFVVVAVSLSWYVDHTDRSRKEIIGKWHVPQTVPGQIRMGYYASLEIRSDGTFSKRQAGRFDAVTYAGRYVCEQDGRIIFHVTSKTETSDFDEAFKKEPEITELNAEYWRRCAVDKSGMLIIVDANLIKSETDTEILWEGFYEPDKK